MTKRLLRFANRHASGRTYRRAFTKCSNFCRSHIRGSIFKTTSSSSDSQRCNQVHGQWTWLSGCAFCSTSNHSLCNGSTTSRISALLPPACSSTIWIPRYGVKHLILVLNDNICNYLFGKSRIIPKVVELFGSNCQSDKPLLTSCFNF